MAKESIRFNKINAPYNFVPLNEKVVIPDWGKQISQDLPFSDGEDGCIEVTVSNLTPIITCDEALVKNGKGMDVRLPARIGDRYYLPGSGLKGMLRNVLEIMTFGKMQQFDDDFFGYRDFMGNDSATRDYPKKMLDEYIHSGWLHLKVDNDGTERYVISECYYRKIEIKELEKYLTGEMAYFESLDAFKKCEFIETKYGKEYKALRLKDSDGDINGVLVCSGKMNGKLHEHCFFGSTGKKLQLSEEVFDKFITVYKPSKCYGEEIVKRLRVGKEIPVFFRIDSAGQVESLGITRCYRYPFKYRVSDFIGEEHKKNSGELDMAECIFGCVNQNGHESALRGRVQVGNGLMSRPLTDSDLGEVFSGVLGQPKASYYPLYIDQRGQEKSRKYKTYDSPKERTRIAGHKRYRVHADDYVTKLPEGNGNDNTTTRFRPLKQGQQFRFKIRVHNLRPVEIGALLSALTFHKSATAHHNFGLAKSFGYGKLQLDKVEMVGFSKTEMDYLKTFEAYMKGFVPNWCNSDQITQLIRIASDHKKGSDIGMMELSDYTKFKKYFSQLKEGGETCPSIMSKKDKYDVTQVCSMISEFVNNGKYDEAESCCDDVKKHAVNWIEIEEAVRKIIETAKNNEVENKRKEFIKLTVEADTLEKIEEALNQLGIIRSKYPLIGLDEQERILEEKRKKLWIYIVVSEGLGSLLEEKNLKGEYKITNFKSLKNKIESYRKNIINFKSADLIAVEGTAKRILANPSNIKREKKDWQSFDKGNAWRYLRDLLGEERAKVLFDKFMK